MISLLVVRIAVVGFICLLAGPVFAGEKSSRRSRIFVEGGNFQEVNAEEESFELAGRVGSGFDFVETRFLKRCGFSDWERAELEGRRWSADYPVQKMGTPIQIRGSRRGDRPGKPVEVFVVTSRSGPSREKFSEAKQSLELPNITLKPEFYVAFQLDGPTKADPKFQFGPLFWAAVSDPSLKSVKFRFILRNCQYSVASKQFTSEVVVNRLGERGARLFLPDAESMAIQIPKIVSRGRSENSDLNIEVQVEADSGIPNQPVFYKYFVTIYKSNFILAGNNMRLLSESGPYFP